MPDIACGYEDADDLHLRRDPGFKLACGRLPDSGADLCSPPTVSLWKNAPDLREVVRLSYAMADISVRQLRPQAHAARRRNINSNPFVRFSLRHLRNVHRRSCFDKWISSETGITSRSAAYSGSIHPIIHVNKK